MTRQSLTRSLGLCVILCATCTGCIIIPTPHYHTSGSRTNVREETTTTINPGHTTKEDVFLALGEPDEVSRDGRQLIYRWTITKAFVGTFLSPMDALNTEYSLIITFDERGMVIHREIESRSYVKNIPQPRVKNLPQHNRLQLFRSMGSA